MSVLKFIKRSIINELIDLTEYRLSAVLFIFLNIILSFTNLFITYSVYSITESGIPGWTFYEVIFLQAIYYVVVGIKDMTFSFNHIPRQIRRGEMDQVLTRPINPLLQFFEPSLYHSGFIFSGIILFIISIPNLSIELTLFNGLFFSILLLLGYVSLLAIELFINSLAFFLTEIGSIRHNIHRIRTRFTKWPMNLYPKIVQLIFAFILPIIFINYAPASFLLNKEISKIFFYSPIIVLALAFLSIKFFYFGLNKYGGTGS